MTAHRIVLAVLLLSICSSSRAQQTHIDFEKQVAPIFAEHCVRCHAPGNRKGDISLATIADLKAKEFVRGGDVDGSYLIELVTGINGEPPAMPKDLELLVLSRVVCAKETKPTSAL